MLNQNDVTMMTLFNLILEITKPPLLWYYEFDNSHGVWHSNFTEVFNVNTKKP